MQGRKLLKKYISNDVREYNFSALKVAMKMKAEEIVSELKESGLKGRGGAAFPTGLKWDFALAEESAKKYIVCNADEGEPGTFKDRYLLEERPLKVLEGILIGAYTIGAQEGYIYIRGEYTTPIRIFEQVIKDAYQVGLLGDNILDSNFSFKLNLVKGAGAYVCGDETSLLNSIEGKRGISRIKPPYPIQEGLYGYPTVVNNVETFANVSEIVGWGGKYYSCLGTAKSKGTKLVCLSGDINKPGLYEVEFGQVTIKEIIEDFGQGIKNDRPLKFVIPGGISTSILTAEEIDIPYSYEDIVNHNSSLGSGALMVVAEGHDLIGLMMNAAKFFMDETCGTCFPCREGNRQIYYLLKRAAEAGGFSKSEFQLIKDIGRTINLAARCGLGQSSLNFIRSIIDNYGDELLAGGEDNGEA